MFSKGKTIELLNETLDLIEFTLVKDNNGKFYLYDEQGIDLGNISEERFNDIGSLIGRLTRYIEDYIVESLDEIIEDEIELGNKDIIDLFENEDYKPNEYLNTLLKCHDYLGHMAEWDFNVLELYLNCEDYKNISLENCCYVLESNFF